MFKKINLQLNKLCLLFIIVTFSASLVICIEDDDDYSYHVGRGFANHFEMIVKNVSVNQYIENKHNFVEMKTIRNGLKTFTIAYNRNRFEIIEGTRMNKEFVFKKIHEQEFEQKVRGVEMFLQYDKETKRDVVVVAYHARQEEGGFIGFFKVTSSNIQKSPGIEIKVWIHQMDFYRHDDQDFLILLTQERDICRFQIMSDPVSIATIQHTTVINCIIDMAALIKHRGDIFYAMYNSAIQKLIIFKLVGYAQFKKYQLIDSPETITSLVSFNIGTKSFLAVGGKNAAIYQFTRNGIIFENVEGGNLNNVKSFFVFPRVVYRDEVILVIERTVGHSTHDAPYIEIILYNGMNFIFQEQVPCIYYGVQMTLTECMTDGFHIKGDLFLRSTVVYLKDIFAILSSHTHHDRTEVFMFRTIYQPNKKPLQHQIEYFKNRKQKLQEMMDAQKPLFQHLKDRAEKTLRLDQPNVVTANWKIDTVSAPALDGRAKSQEYIVKDSTIDLSALERKVNHIEGQIEWLKTVTIRTTNLENEYVHFPILVVDGDFEVYNETVLFHVTTEVFNDEKMPEFLEDFVRKGDVKPIKSQKTFTNLDVEDLTFESINQQNLTSNRMVFNEDLILDEPVTVLNTITSRSGLINNYSLKNEVVEIGDNKVHNKPLQFEYVIVDSLQTNNFSFNFNIVWDENKTIELDVLNIPGNVVVETVNEEGFDDFIDQLFFTNAKNYVGGRTTIDGDLNVEGSIHTKVLNGLQFPDDYIFNDDKLPIIAGNKTFVSDLFIRQLITDGKVNGIPLNDTITLSTLQTLKGKYTFTSLEVTTDINIEGDVAGINTAESIENPTLEETDIINATVNFYDLHVNGNVIISNNFNGANFEASLKDVVYKNEGNVTITSSKDFQDDVVVKENLHTNSNSINEISLEKFLTKYTEQTLTLPKIYGKVHFKNLTLKGLYGNVNVSQLDQETLKASGEQFVTSLLTIDSSESVDLSATEFAIMYTLNGLPVNEYYFINGNRIFKNSLNFQILLSEILEVDGKINGELKGFHLGDFDRKRLSYTRDQTITANYKVKNLHTTHLSADVINGEVISDKLLSENYGKQITQMLRDGKLKVKRLMVEGNVTVGNINGQSVDWCRGISSFNTINFENNVVTDNLEVNEFNSIPFETFEGNIVYKRSKNIVINGYKMFENGFKVKKMLNSVRLNGIHVDDILMKSGNQNITGPITIVGKVRVQDNCEIRKCLNNQSVNVLENVFQINDNAYRINHDIIIDDVVFISELQVNGYVNDENFGEFLKNTVHKNQKKRFSGKIVFGKPVKMHQNMLISGNLNNEDFPEFIENIVFTTNDAVISGNSYFKEHVIIGEDLIVTDLLVQNVCGIDLYKWTYNAVYLNRGRIPGIVTFESAEMLGNITSIYLNDMDMYDVIDLHSDEVLKLPMKFSKIRTNSHIAVGNLVNNQKLEEIQNTTLQKDKISQSISHKIRFNGPVNAINKLVFNNLINGNDVSKIVTTNTQQTLRALYNFEDDVALYSLLKFEKPEINTLNNIKLSDWKSNGITVYSEDKFPLTIKYNWMVEGNVTFNQNVWGDKQIGEFNISAVQELVREKQLHRNTSQMSLQTYYTTLCKQINTKLYQAKNQVYFFKYLEFLRTIEANNTINYVHHFVHNQKVYILINERDACNTDIYVWEDWDFKKIEEFPSGNILQFITVYDNNLLFVVGRNEEHTCSIQGTNVWKFEENSFELKMLLEDQELLQESLVPGTFYGLNKNVVVEYKLETVTETNAKRYRKWTVAGDNLRFVPGGLKIGLALSDGTKLLRLLREESATKEEFRYEIDASVVGSFTKEMNSILPGYLGDDILILNVGTGGNQQTLLAVATHEETSVRGRFDFIKIYEDIIHGKIFHKVPSYKPSSLISLEFENGETLLVFLEDNKVLQVYEYKGIEGFKHRTSVKMKASKLLVLDLSTEVIPKYKKIIGAIHGNKVTFMQAIMTGNQASAEIPPCDLL